MNPHDDAAGAVLLDIDGTLVDSSYVHTAAWSRAFREAGHPVDSWRTHRCIGMGGDLLLAELLGDRADELGDEVKRRHDEHYAASAVELHRFDGVPELLAAITERGARAVLASSASPAELDILRTVLEVDEDTHPITSSQDVDAAKPHPDLVHAALAVSGAGADRAVFVGDAVWDVEAAARAGLPCVGVLTGGISAAELTGAGAVAVYRSVAELGEDIDSSPLRRAWPDA
ncbi:HAD family hydrolase [Georgenia sunbinii]|uniref:HAD family hydrolase n=1 Tax=Georgenia sunbinii TaxID=3117728 RepID=UPI002F26B985